MKYVCGMALMVFALGACGNKDNNNAATPMEDMQDVTDTSQCHGTPDSSATILGSYTSQAQSKHFSAVLRMRVEENQVTVENDCSSGYTARVTVPSSYSSTQFSILRNGSDVEGPDSKNTCSVTAEVQSVPYQLVGNCIMISKDGKQRYMVREGSVGHSRQNNNNNQDPSNYGPSGSTQAPEGYNYSQQSPQGSSTQMPAMPQMPQMPNQ
jgi:hypothetical protein